MECNQVKLNLIGQIVLLLVFCVNPFVSYGTGTKDSLDIMDQEIQIQVDNDALILGSPDQYYSSGIFVRYRRLMKSTSFGYRLGIKPSLQKAIVSFDLFHRMYTPSNIKYSQRFQIDRPYAGWFGGNIGLEYFYKKNSVLKLNVDVGWLGPATRTDDLQIWWHDKLNMKKPRGWEYQINNTPATHVGIEYSKKIVGTKGIDLISNSSSQFGTIKNNIRTGVGLRIGRFEPLFSSIYSGSRLGLKKSKLKDIPVDKRLEEIYFFANLSYEYVFYNATIQGNFIGEASNFTKSIESTVFHQEYGIARSGQYFDLYVSYIARSTEVVGSQRHHYITIRIALRF